MPIDHEPDPQIEKADCGHYATQDEVIVRDGRSYCDDCDWELHKLSVAISKGQSAKVRGRAMIHRYRGRNRPPRPHLESSILRQAGWMGFNEKKAKTTYGLYVDDRKEKAFHCNVCGDSTEPCKHWSHT